MTGRERVIRALAFQGPDRVPRYFSFWEEFTAKWRERKGGGDIERHFGSDLTVVAADETAWPLSAGLVEARGDEEIHRTGWGVVERHRKGAKFSEELGTRLTERVDPGALRFDDPLLDRRYDGAGAEARRWRETIAVFCKTGGPYLRAAFMRGQEQFLMDIAEDPEWVRAFVGRVTDHIADVGCESIRRFGLQETGIGIFDDVCTSAEPIMGRRSYEKLFFPGLCRMVAAYKKAGARTVFHHCDGNATDLLDLWVAAGIDAVHPLEARVCPEPIEVRRRFGKRLAVIGGLDNCSILPRGDRGEIRRHIARLLEAADGGGYILAPHSIGPDISIETMEYVLDLLEKRDG